MSDDYGMQIVPLGETYEGAQGITYGAGTSAETTGAGKICMNVMPIPRGGRAKAHYHEGIEAVALLRERQINVYYGVKLEHVSRMQPGDHIYIPGDVAHAPFNQTDTPGKFIASHSSGSDQDDIVMLPKLDETLARK